MIDECEIDIACEEGEFDGTEFIEGPAASAAAGGDGFVPDGGDLIAQGCVFDLVDFGKEFGDLVGGVLWCGHVNRPVEV